MLIFVHTYWFIDEAFIIVEAKNLKLRQARGISTVLASNTGLPWSLDSASANSSNFDSIRSAIFLMIFARNSGGVFDQLIRERWASYQSTDMISNQSNIISTIIVTIFVVHINTPSPPPPPPKCLPTKYQEPHLLGNLDTRQKLIFSQYVVKGPFHLISTPPYGSDFLRGSWKLFLRGWLCRHLMIF